MDSAQIISFYLVRKIQLGETYNLWPQVFFLCSSFYFKKLQKDVMGDPKITEVEKQ